MTTGRRPSGPNLQNIPIRTELGRQVREAFAPKEQLIVADYAEIERRVAKPCPDCDVLPGQEHQPGCDVERCSVCKGQFIGCGCEAHDPAKSKWDGEWPGTAECRERGWFCQDGFGPSPKWGSFCPCPPDAPGAMPDMNRLAYFNATGRDDMYDGCDRKPRT